VAHEIRNPLTVMKLLYHSLDLRFAADDPRARDARILGQKIEHLNRIVERILDLARPSEPLLGPVNVNQLLDELGLLVRHKLQHQRVALVRQLAPALPAVRGDATQLEQAFLNLILNAAEAMPAGGTLTLTTRPGRARRGATPPVVVEIQDTGKGMTEAQRRNAFRTVFRSTKAKGAGLGLAIAGRIVEAHRGRIELKPRRGGGTRALVTLPTQP
jgi:signal transduction histidine kinase